MNKNSLLDEKTNQQDRWRRLCDEKRVSHTHLYKLIKDKLILSVLLQTPGSKKGCRFIDVSSLDRYLDNLAAEQQENPVFYTAHLEKAEAGRRKAKVA
jgi:hypothetical protein